jgi:hypothetical protein
MKVISIVCELGVRFKYPHPLDCAEVLANSCHDKIVFHGRPEDSVFDWNSNRGFTLDLSINATSGLIKTVRSVFACLCRNAPSVVVCFSPSSLSAALLFKAWRYLRSETVSICYYALELEKPSFNFKAGGRLSWLLFLLPLAKIVTFTTGPCRAKVLRNWFALSVEPTAIMNCALLRQASKVSHSHKLESARNPGQIRTTPETDVVSLVCAGGLSKLNCIYEILDSLYLLPEYFVLNLIGPISAHLLESLSNSYLDLQRSKRIIYHGEVQGSREELIVFLSQFTIGIALKNPAYSGSNINDVLYTPTKVFDYIAAGIPSLVTENPETSILASLGCSLLLNQHRHEHHEIASAFLCLHDELASYQEVTRRAFVQVLNYDLQATPLISFVKASLP